MLGHEEMLPCRMPCLAAQMACPRDRSLHLENYTTESDSYKLICRSLHLENYTTESDSYMYDDLGLVYD